jgi:hypothetical protein
MSIPIIIMGDSGTGKSTSIRTFKEGEAVVLNVQGKLMPFFEPKVHQVNVPQIASKNNNALKVDVVSSWLCGRDKETGKLKHDEYKAVIVDDCGYCITEMYMRWAVSGDEMMNDQFGVYKEIAGRMWRLFSRVIEDGEADRIVYFVFHEETDNHGKVDLLTVGKLLNEKIKIRGLVTCTLQSAKLNDEYVFYTNNGNPAKSPMGLFDDTIPNDLRAVDSRIREAYGIAPLKVVKANA